MPQTEEDENPCPHGEQTRGKCKVCRDAPVKKRVVVHFSAGGTHHHRIHDCPALEYGQQQVDERGGMRAQIQWAYEDIISIERSKCSVCFHEENL